MADQAKGKGIAPKRASNPADSGQSSRPLPPIRTLLEDKEDGEDYSKVIEVLKQHIKSYKRDSVSAIKNISSTLASLTNSSNAAAATTRKTSYTNSNLDPPIDTGSKEGFKDTITSSIVKELSKKAYTIPDDKNPDISNTYSDSDQAVLLMLLRDSLSSSPRAAISWIHIPSKAFKLLVRQYSRPIESKKEDVYNEFHALTFRTYRKGLSAFNAEFNGYLAKLTIAKIDIDPSLILNYLNIEYLIANILEESRNPAIEAYRAAHITNSSNSTPNLNSNPSKKGKNKKKGKKKASYNVEGQNCSTKSAEQASFIPGSYNLAIKEEEESDSSSNSRYKKRKDFKGKGLKTSSNNKAKYKDNQPRRRPRDPALYNSWLYNTGSTDYINNSKERPISPAGIGSITLEVLSRKAPPTYTKLVLDNVLYLPHININIVSGRNKIVVEIPSDSIRKEDYRPIIEDAIVSEAIEPKKRYKLRNSPAKGTTLEEGELVDLDLDLEGAISLNLSNLNTEKPISIELGPSKQEPYESSSDNKLDKPIPDKPINPVIVESTRPTISIRKPELPEAFPKTIEPIFAPKPIEVIAPNQPITNEPLNNIDLISEGDKMQLDYYKLLGAFLNSALREEIYIEIPKGLLDRAASNKAIYKLLLKYSYNPSTPNIIKLSKALYNLKQSPREWQDKLKILLKSLGYLPLISDLGVFYNAKTCYFIVTYIDDCLFIGPDIGYITDLKKRLNKYTTTKLSRDFHSKEGPRPLTTTSTTIVDSRNSKGSSRTSIINSSLVPIGFSDSDFTGDKAASKSTYGYLYKLAGRPISWETKRVTTIALSTLEAETDGLTEAIREVQWIIGLFSELHRPIDHPVTLYGDNQGSITVANNPVLHATTKYTLLKFHYVREQVKAKIVTIIYLNTKFNSTGYFTALWNHLIPLYSLKRLIRS
ncbi:hypothetical protein P8C59_005246 [Phyllachora maydis]|uniref:Reverse transcriptase Ty1/copia-type domain-containing protein n=1 Tax=Phyllachora maydis TaxID=1825666 RepID=A0AAD9I5Q8_9PEZI|nr:hypothetical protein P8C59_005246 [Phyllachora maydis]